MQQGTPLNGTKIHPLSQPALGILDRLRSAPCPTQEINAGVIARLKCEGLIEFVQMVSPYKVHKGGKISFTKITAAGIARCEQL